MYGRRIRELRENLGMSQTQFIDAFVSKYGEEYRMAQTALSKYEQEQREPKNELLIAFADFFGVTTDYLLGVEIKKDNSPAMELVSNFNERFKIAFGDRNVTEFADDIGVSKQAISAYLTGMRKPKKIMMSIIANKLNVNPLWLMGYNVNKNSVSLKKEEFFLNGHEQLVITAYRNHPEMQPAVDTLLGVEKDESELIKVQVAARSNKNTKPHSEYITKAENDAEDALLQDPDEDM